MTAIQTRTEPLRTIGDALRADKGEILVSDIKKLIAEAALFRGYDLKASDNDVMARTYLADLRKYFGGLDLAEIGHIIRSGIRKEYGDFYGLNAGTLYDWTCAYMNSAKREEYVAQRRERADEGRMLEEHNEWSQADIDELMKNQVNKSYAAYREMMGKARSEEPSGNPSFARAFRWATKTSDYPIGHPLCDLGNSREEWLHQRGYTGSLREIFDEAMQNGKTRII